MTFGFVLPLSTPGHDDAEANSKNGVFRVSSDGTSIFSDLLDQKQQFIVDTAVGPEVATGDGDSVTLSTLNERLKAIFEGRNAVFFSCGAKQAATNVCPALFGNTSDLASPSSSSLLQSVLAAFAQLKAASVANKNTAGGGLSGKITIHVSALEIAGERVFDLLDCATTAASASSSSSSSSSSAIAAEVKPIEKKLKFDTTVLGGAANVDGLAFAELNDLAGSAASIVSSCLRYSFRSGAVISAPPTPLVAQSTTLLVQLYVTRKEPGLIYRSVVSLVDVPCDFIDPPPPQPAPAASQHIFTSSTALRKCIDHMITSGSPTSPVSPSASAPFRQSALTMLVSDVFTGNALLHLIAVVSNTERELKGNNKHHHQQQQASSLKFPAMIALLRLFHTARQQIGPVSARINYEKVAGAVTDMRSEVEELRRRLEAERLAREQEYGARGQEVADMESRRRKLEQEQRAKKALNAQALASISKQMRTLQSLQAQLMGRQSLLQAASAAKEQKAALEEEQAQRQERLRQEAEIVAMREQEAILQRQIAVQLEAQLAVQRRLREDAERSRTDLLSREMSFVFRAAAQRTRDAAETAALRAEVDELRRQVDDMEHEEQCMQSTVAALDVHVAALKEQHAYMEQRHRVMDTLLNDGIEARATDIREAERCLSETKLRLEKVEQSRKEIETQCRHEKEALEHESSETTAAALSVSASPNRNSSSSPSLSSSSVTSNLTILKRLRNLRDRKKATLEHLMRDNDMLRVKRASAEEAALKARKDAEIAAHELREAELLNARRRQEEADLGEQLADTLRASAAYRKRSNQLEGSIAAIQVQLRETEVRRAQADESLVAFEAFLCGGETAPPDGEDKKNDEGDAQAAPLPVSTGSAHSAQHQLLAAALALSPKRKAELQKRLFSRQVSAVSTASTAATDSSSRQHAAMATTTFGSERAAKRVELALQKRN